MFKVYLPCAFFLRDFGGIFMLNIVEVADDESNYLSRYNRSSIIFSISELFWPFGVFDKISIVKGALNYQY